MTAPRPYNTGPVAASTASSATELRVSQAAWPATQHGYVTEGRGMTACTAGCYRILCLTLDATPSR